MFDIPSKAELSERSDEFSAAPLEAGNYIVRVAGIMLRKAATFENGIPNDRVPTVVFDLVCLPVRTESGDDMIGVDGKVATPFSRWLFRNINPFAIGFQQDKVTPAFMRGFLAAMMGVSLNDRITPEEFVLLDANLNEVTDEELRAQFIAETTAAKTQQIPSKMVATGFKAIPDIRSYTGRYIGATLQIKTKGDKSSNAISLFNRVPKSFVAPKDAEFAETLSKFNASYEKMVQKRTEEDMRRFGSVPTMTKQAFAAGLAKKPSAQAATPSSLDEEIQEDDMLKVDDIPFGNEE